MGKVRAFAGIALAMAVLALLGCSGDSGSNTPHTAGPGPAQQSPSVELPAPSVVRASAEITSGVFRHGKQYVDALVHNAVTVGESNSLVFAPGAGAGGIDGAAYAIYSFDSTGYSTDNTLHLAWLAHGADYTGLWVGLANFTRDRWDWFSWPAADVLPYDAAKYTVDGQVYVVVLCLSGESWELRSIRISEDVPPVVESVTPLECSHGQAVVFHAVVDGIADSYSWSFGGGATPNKSSESEPQVLPGDSGQYDATLTVANAYGEDKYSFTFNVSGQLISGTVKMADAAGLANVQLSLTPGKELASTDENGAYVIFGVEDGSYTLTPLLAGWNILPGNRTITIAGQDAAGNDFIAYSLPVAELTGVPLEGIEPLGVSFDASASYDPDNGGEAGKGILKYKWDWTNDGTFDYDSGTDATVSHVYASAEEFVCRVQVIDDEYSRTTDTVSLSVINGEGPYFACGYVKDAAGIGIPEVQLNFTGSLAPVVTNTEGYWMRDNIPPGTYTASPSKDGWWFDPASRELPLNNANLYNINFVGYDSCHLTGTCRTAGMAGIVNVTISISNDGDSVVTDAAGDYLKTGLGLGEYTLTPSFPGWEFSPPTQTVVFSELGLKRVDFTGSHGFVWGTLGHDNKRTGCSQFNGPATSALRWRTTLGDDFVAAPSTVSIAIGIDDTIYGAIYDHLFAINPDGSVKWTLTFNKPDYKNSVSIGTDGTIYYTNDSTFYKLNPDATQEWVYTTTSIINDAPVISTDGTAYLTCWGGILDAITPDGSLQWEYIGPSYFISAPALADDGTIYFTDCDHVYMGNNKLYAMNPNGSLKWSYQPMELGDSFTAPAIAEDGTVYFLADYSNDLIPGRLYAVKPDGILYWTCYSGNQYFKAPIIGHQGAIYIIGVNRLDAFSPDGGLLWDRRVDGSYDTNSFAMVTSNDGALFCVADHYIAAISANGDDIWAGDFQFDAHGAVTTGYGAAAIGADGTLYVASHHGTVLAIGPGRA